MRQLILRNAQRHRPIRLRLLRRILTAALTEDLELRDYVLGIRLVGPRAMARANRQYLDHEGPADVITFDHSADWGGLCGDLYVCPAVAEAQAKAFRTAWQSELVRYAIHGILHLLGYDDITSAARRVMKQREGRILRQLQSRFAVRDLG